MLVLKIFFWSGTLFALVVLALFAKDRFFGSYTVTPGTWQTVPGDWHDSTTGTLDIMWSGTSWTTWLEPNGFLVKLRSFVDMDLTSCNMTFDKNRILVDQLRFNTSDRPSTSYDQQVAVIKPGVIYEVGQNAYVAGVNLDAVPKTVGLHCREGYAEWATGF